jgi:hypothetical protein
MRLVIEAGQQADVPPWRIRGGNLSATSKISSARKTTPYSFFHSEMMQYLLRARRHAQSGKQECRTGVGAAMAVRDCLFDAERKECLHKDYS